MDSHGPSEWIRKERHELAHMSKELLQPNDPTGEIIPATPPSPNLEGEGPVNFFSVPEELLKGSMMTKVSEKKQRRVLFQLDPDEGRILYKSKKGGIVPLESVKEIRSGQAARYHRQEFSFPEDTEDRWLTIIYILNGTYKTLHVLADTSEVLAMWEAAVRRCVAVRQGLMTGLGNVEIRDAMWERLYWKRADVEPDNKLTFPEVVGLAKRLNTAFSTIELKQFFDIADPEKKGSLDFPGFQVFVKELTRRPEIEAIYRELCERNGGKFEYPAFENFMRETQNSDASDAELKELFASISSPEALDTTPSASSNAPGPTPTPSPPVLTLEGFSSFLISPNNAAFSDQTREIWQDMSRPMSEYFISASHNTYLVGNQLVGVSTIEGYIRALLHSCRSVELDIYDGDPEPVIFHGKTLTKKVPLRAVCAAIAKYAFVTSPYPLLISAEIHCSVKQQDLIVSIMLEAFGEDLVRLDVEPRPVISVLPSPNDLKGRYLVKVFVTLQLGLPHTDDFIKAKNLYVAAQLDAMRVKKPKASDERLQTIEVDTSTDDADSDSDVGSSGLRSEIKSGLLGLKDKWRRVRGKDKDATPAAPKVKMSFELASLLVYTVGVKCRGFGKDHQYAPEHIFSLSENKVNKIVKAKDEMRDLVVHTQTHLVRTYPKGSRVESTNYEPHRFWAAGAQVVAINWQTFDLGYMMNQAMFQRNGRAGCVLKPEALRPGHEELLLKHSKHILEVTIISGYRLPRPRDSTGQEIVSTKSVLDPLVQVSLHIPDWAHPPHLSTLSSTSLSAPEGSPVPAARVWARTRVVKNNGFNPVWREVLRLPFDVVGGVSMRDLILVQFSVRDEERLGDGDEPIAQYFTPLSCLEQGYRHLPLHDAQLSQYLFSTLFVRVHIRDVHD
ncbi:hypothetical protein H0H81_010974 [Sphagnurus paluster]|uniref:Phosphoinositide phospholipase C n=1 Tax=Sphagnurus paluster TaxID=117069 RepID=A0A9P7GHQ2_9AGAR|nr:hypothetical protein H0H81_010974 [Sphagnurus paluster]